MNNLILCALVVLSIAWADQSCHAQNWRDPTFQQPLPQYYPPNRYPLDSPNELPPTGAPAPLPVHRKSAAPAQTTIAPVPPPSDAVKSLRLPPKRSKSVAPAPSNLPPRTNKSAAKRLPAKKSKTAKTDKRKQPTKPAPPVITYDIYRDRSQFPIDPRKPCSVCRRPVGRCSCGVDHGQHRFGNGGQPYQEKEPGGLACGKNCPDKRPMFSVYWPRPFSAKRADRHPHGCSGGECTTRINDLFDHLINFKLIDYQRTDNGYFGPGADPYGCLGESKYQGLGM